MFRRKISDENTPDADTDQTDSASVSIGFWDYLKVLIALVFVIGLLLFILKYLNKRNFNYQQNAVIKNIGGMSVGQQKSVQLLLIGKRVYVVGVGDNIQLLKEIDSEEEIDHLLNQIETKQSMVNTSPYIAQLFNKFSQKNALKIFRKALNSMICSMKKSGKSSNNEVMSWSVGKNRSVIIDERHSFRVF